MSKLAKTLNQAIQHHAAGNLTEAEHACRRVLQSNPANADALNLLGVVCYQSGRAEEGIDLISRAIRISPGGALYYNNLGNAMLQAGRVDEALAAYEKALSLSPRFIDAIINRANVLSRNKQDLDSALSDYRQALEIDPASTEALIGLGRTLHASGQVQDAAAHFETLRQKFPDHPGLLYELGLVYHDQKDYAKAGECFEAVLRVRSDDAPALAMWGRALNAAGNFEGAIEKYRTSLAIQPNLAAGHFNLGNVYHKLKRYDEAEACYERALQLDPAYFSAWINLGQTCHVNGRHEQAMQAYQQAFSLKPSYGLCLEKGLLLPVIYSSAQDVAEHRARYFANLSALLREPFVLQDPRNELKTAVNFYLAYQGDNDRDAQEALGHLVASGLKAGGFDYPWRPPAEPRAKPRIGFISRHFRPGHTILKLTEGLIRKLDRDAFDVYVFHIDHAAAPAEVMTGDGRVVMLPENNFRMAQQMIARHELDVLVYADIGMEPGGYLLAHSRLARVQCALWGHPVTTGIGNIDYFLSSALIEPDNAAEHYTEKLVLFETLPAFYTAPEKPGAVSKSDFGFSEKDRLYLCPQSIFKLHPAFDAMLGNILRQDPDGRIVLIRDRSENCNGILMSRLREALGDLADRVVLTERLSPERFLGLLGVADVMLDPVGFGGGNTTYEALALGTPVVTLPGEFMRGRVTLGCYLRMNVSDCVATTPEEYVEIAVRLGTDPAFRQVVREKILAENHRLYEDDRAVAELGEFFRQALAAASAPVLQEQENTHV